MSGINIDLLRDVEELAAIGVGYDRLVAIAQERHHERARAKYRKANKLEDWEPVDVPMPKGAASRTIDRYIKSIRERWATEEVEHRPQRRAELRAKLQATFLKAYMEGGPSLSSATQCLRAFMKMDGLEAPQEIKVTGQVDVRALSPAERRSEMDRLWEKRQRALGVVDVKALPAPKKGGVDKKTSTKSKPKARKKPIRATAKSKKAPAKKKAKAKPKKKASK